MADLERINPLDEAQLRSALQTTDAHLRRRLPDEEYSSLVVLFDQMQARYPSQDLADSTEGYLADFEQLALKYSVRKVQDALAELRISPGQRFFPRPDEVATMIEIQMENGRHVRERQMHDSRRQREIQEFWENLPFMLERTGLSEDEFLKRWPSMRGTKPFFQAAAHPTKLVSMPPRDSKMAAAGDADEAA